MRREAGSDAAAPATHRWPRLIAAILCGLVLGAALGSGIASALAPQPTSADFGAVADDLLPAGTIMSDIKVIRAAAGRGPVRLEATALTPFPLPQSGAGINNEDTIRRAEAQFEGVGCDFAPGPCPALHGHRDGLWFRLTGDGRLEIGRLREPTEPIAMLLGGLAQAALAGFRSARRQARPQPHRVVRLITSASWAILPGGG